MRRALEEAWFADAPLRIKYNGANDTTTRRIRVRSVVMERTETLVNALDLDKNEERQFRLDRIEHASVEE
jgi:predicted DNA-binding transcriptional regulator YafY